MFTRILSVFAFVLMLATVRGAGAEDCWECETLPDPDDYPGITCAPVSISDQGSTECYVRLEPNKPIECVFEDPATRTPGDLCSWQPPTYSPPKDPPHQGCDDSSLRVPGVPAQVVTPNGSLNSSWSPAIPRTRGSEG
jgi:hypothetical protein